YTKNGDGKIDNNTWSAAFTYSLGAHALMLGYQRVSDDSNFVQLNQGGIEGSTGASVYLLTDRLIHSFTRAGERTAFGQYSYDFANVGVPGLKASAAYLKGTSIKVAGDRKSTRLNSSHVKISYAVFCLKKKRQVTLLITEPGLYKVTARAI